jgi:CheY-like chemotaxis protein
MLIVDDNPRMRAMIRTLLNETGDWTIECGNGAEAVDLYRTHMPDWVMMDIAMPVLDGISATRRIVALDHLARVVIVTDYYDPQLEQAAFHAGAVAYVPKDNLLKLLEVVR